MLVWEQSCESDDADRVELRDLARMATLAELAIAPGVIRSGPERQCGIVGPGSWKRLLRQPSTRPKRTAAESHVRCAASPGAGS